jgi:hypothetical protein
MNGLRVYIAGGMDSVGGNFNFPLFDTIAEGLRAKGCEVFSPADHAREKLGSLEDIQKLDKKVLRQARQQLLRDEINWIIDDAQVMVMLPGWERSPGATAERAVALAFPERIKIVEADTIMPGLKLDVDIEPE